MQLAVFMLLKILNCQALSILFPCERHEVISIPISRGSNINQTVGAYVVVPRCCNCCFGFVRLDIYVMSDGLNYQ